MFRTRINMFLPKSEAQNLRESIRMASVPVLPKQHLTFGMIAVSHCVTGAVVLCFA